MKTARSFKSARNLFFGAGSMQTNNYAFNVCFFSLSAILGSISSFFLVSAFVWAIFRIVEGKISLIRDKRITLFALVFAAYPAARLFSFVINQREISAIGAIAGSILFLSVIPVLSRLMISSPQSIVNSVGIGAANSGMILFAFSIVQYLVFDIPRPEAGLGNAAVMGAFALTICCICLALVRVMPVEWRAYLLAGVFCSLCAIAFSGTRAVWVATPFAVVAAGWHLVGGTVKTAQTRTTLFISAAILFALPLIAVLVYDRIWLTFENFKSVETLASDVSLGHRIFMWQNAIEKIRESWLFGYGPDSAAEIMASFGNHTAIRYTHFHNFIIDSLIRGGIVELGAILSVFGVVVWVSLQKSVNQYQLAGRRLLLSVIFATVIPALTGILFSHDIINAVFLYSVIIGLRLSIANEDQSSER